MDDVTAACADSPADSAPGAVAPMRILVVSWYMPPFNTMGALRVGKLCKYLAGAGHDVRVLSCADVGLPETLALEFPEARILRTGSLDINALPRLAQRLRLALRGGGAGQAPPSPAPAAGGDGATAIPRRGPLGRTLRAVRLAWQDLVNIPDAQIGWLPAGIRAGRRLLETWRPDAVFASAPPFTALMIGRALSRRSGAPLIVEYRDRLVEDPYFAASVLRKSAERRLEDWWMRDAQAIVTVSDPWAEDYRARFGLPVATVYNGFDPDDFPADYPREPGDPATLGIVYTGILYGDRRDPRPLFRAIPLLGEDARHIRVAFYGAQKRGLMAWAAECGVSQNVDWHERVPYADSIALQMNADILLLLQWNDPKEAGNVPGKLFEYLGARRPVLGIGYEDGVPARILRARNAGLVINDPAAIAERLRRWLAEKRTTGRIPLLPLSARHGLSRPEQYAQVERFVERVVRRSRHLEHGGFLAGAGRHRL